MKVVHWEGVTRGLINKSEQGRAATIGVFDGVHRGHQELLGRVVHNGRGYEPVAVTFMQNPKKENPHKQFGRSIYSLKHKLELLEALGIKLCVLIDFSGDFSKMGGYEFISTLTEQCDVRYLAVGDDFKCGYRLSTDAVSFKTMGLSLGASVDIVEPIVLHGEKVSSSRIRAAIAGGHIDLAHAMLGRPYALDLRSMDTEIMDAFLRVRPGARGYVLPRDGVYNGTLKGSLGSFHGTIDIQDGQAVFAVSALRGDPLFLEFDT